MTPHPVEAVVLDSTSLRRSWEEIVARDRADGEVSDSIGAFAVDVDDRLTALHDELRGGTYQPSDLTEVILADDDDRVLHVPRVRDRIVERSVLRALTPHVDPFLGPHSYAYRPGLGVRDAVQALAGLRDEGLGWALHTDVDDCFPSVPVDLVRRMVRALVADDGLVALLDQLLARTARRHTGGRSTVRGLPQGCAKTPPTQLAPSVSRCR